MRNWKNWINLRVLLFALAPLPLLSYLAPQLLLNLLEAWLPYLLLPYGVLLLLAVGQKRILLSLWIIAWCIPAGMAVYPYLTKRPVSYVAKTTEPSLRLAQINLLQFNTYSAAILEAVEHTQADVLAFQEVDARWACQLEKALSAEYPYQLSLPQNNCYGMAVFSRLPVQEWQVHHWQGYPAISALTRHRGTDTLILSLHAASPVSKKRFSDRNRQLQQASALLSSRTSPAILLGDFNTVPWDKPLRQLKQETRLRDSRLGYQATWPSWLGRYGIPIDYVLHSTEWQVLQTYTLFLPGSDHRAIITDLQLNTCAL